MTHHLRQKVWNILTGAAGMRLPFTNRISVFVRFVFEDFYIFLMLYLEFLRPFFWNYSLTGFSLSTVRYLQHFCFDRLLFFKKKPIIDVWHGSKDAFGYNSEIFRHQVVEPDKLIQIDNWCGFIFMRIKFRGYKILIHQNCKKIVKTNST